MTDVIDSVTLGTKACFTLKSLKRIDVLSQSISLTLSQIYSECADTFTNIGTYKKEHHICIQNGVKSVVQPPGKISYAMRQQLKACLTL